MNNNLGVHQYLKDVIVRLRGRNLLSDGWDYGIGILKENKEFDIKYENFKVDQNQLKIKKNDKWKTVTSKLVEIDYSTIQ